MCLPITREARLKEQEKQIEMMKAVANLNVRCSYRSIFEIVLDRLSRPGVQNQLSININRR